ncbi:MAG: segregation and condensation protein A [Gemmataceae bacterium]
MDYQVKIESFQGPLDLLLYLVKRNEVDIRDIPISQVTEQYLEYIQLLRLIDVEQAGDFLVMAATLMEIKSMMLLPRPEEAAQEEEDPRLDLVKQLIEYKRFKEAAALLEARAEEQSHRIARQPPEPVDLPDPSKLPLRKVELWDLVSAFGRIMQETLAQQPQSIIGDPTPVHVYIDNILQRLNQETRVSFTRLFTPPHFRSRLIGLFLALLELIRDRRLVVEQPEPFGEIWLCQGDRQAS